MDFKDFIYKFTKKKSKSRIKSRTPNRTPNNTSGRNKVLVRLFYIYGDLLIIFSIFLSHITSEYVSCFIIIIHI